MEALGNGIVVVCGIFEPGAVVELIRVSGENVLRAEGGETMGRRTVSDDGEVGFDGLTPGDQFFVCGYVGGRYTEVRAKAQDPSLGISLFQPPAQPNPTTVGTSETPAPDVPPAPVEGSEGTGLPTGVESPVLEPEAPSSTTSTIPVEVTTSTTVPGTTVEGEAQASEGPPAPEPSPPAEPSIEASPAPEPPPTEEIPAAELPDAPPAETPTPQETPEEGAQREAVEAGEKHAQLVAQAEGFSVPNAASLSDDELRQAITEKNVTPVV